MSLVEGNYKLKKNIKQKKLSKEEELELQFEKEATKRIGGSMVYVKKEKKLIGILRNNFEQKSPLDYHQTQSFLIKLKTK